MSSLLTFLKKRERSLNLSTLKKSCFLKLALLVNFLLWCFKTEKKIWKIIFWRYWNSYYLMLLIGRYFQLVYKFDFYAIFILVQKIYFTEFICLPMQFRVRVFSKTMGWKRVRDGESPQSTNRTSKQVLHMPFASQNHLFQHFNIIFHRKHLKNENMKEW